MITNKNMSNEELVEKLINTTIDLCEKDYVRTRDIERLNNIREEILSRMEFEDTCECEECNTLKFISTPSHGYLLVPENIMKKYPKIEKKISEFSWMTDGIWYLEEDIDATLFINETGIPAECVKFVGTEDDISLDVISQYHPAWNVFCAILDLRLINYPCDAKTLRQSKYVLREFFPEINLGKTLEYFRTHGGFCDCEVLMNVDGK